MFFYAATDEESKVLTDAGASCSVRAVQDTISAFDSGDVHFIVDVTSSLASTPSERKADRAQRNKVRNGTTLRDHGGALTETPIDRTGQLGSYNTRAGKRSVESRIIIDRAALKPARGVTKALVDNPSYVAFGHELLGHALGRMFGVGKERESRVFENTYIRSPRKLPARALP